MISEMMQCFHLCWKRKGLLVTSLAADLEMSRFRNGLREKVLLLMLQSLVHLRQLMFGIRNLANGTQRLRSTGNMMCFVATEYLFSAIINLEGEELASKRSGRESTSYCGRACRISCNLQRSQAILTRVDEQMIISVEF